MKSLIRNLIIDESELSLTVSRNDFYIVDKYFEDNMKHFYVDFYI
jgi:hypothetical protein